MKKAEIILIALAVIGVIMKFLHFPKLPLVFVFCTGILSLVYFSLGFALFNNIRLRDIFRKDSYINTNAMKIIGAIATGFSLSMIVLGILFRIMNYPGAEIQLISSLFFLFVVVTVSFFKIKKDTTQYYSKILKRILFFWIIGTFLLFVPRNTWLEWSYPNNPDYIKAIIEAENNPNNQELQLKLQQERQKMIDQSHNEK